MGSASSRLCGLALGTRTRGMCWLVHHHSGYAQVRSKYATRVHIKERDGATQIHTTVVLPPLTSLMQPQRDPGPESAVVLKMQSPAPSTPKSMGASSIDRHDGVGL